MTPGWTFLILSVAVYISRSDAITTEVIAPIRATGDEVALIFIPEILLQAQNYRKVAKAIQEASNLRMWVVLTDHYFAAVPGIHQTPQAVDTAIKDLKKAGMTSEIYVGVGHGMGGHFLQADIGTDNLLKALILMGSHVTREKKLHEFSKPILTLAADLDGKTRISRIAVELGKLEEDMSRTPASLFRTPVVVIEGANHAQFASDVQPDPAGSEDLEPDIAEEDTHLLIGKHVNSFLTATFSTSSLDRDNATAELVEAYENSIKKLQPFLSMKTFGTNGDFSQWTVAAQKHFAGEFADEIEVHDEVETEPFVFLLTQPYFSKPGNRTIINTTTFVDFQDDHAVDMDSEGESAVEINMKLKSKAAIRQALTSQDRGNYYRQISSQLIRAPNTCRSLNELALDIAWAHSTPKARDRYRARGRPIIFEDDKVYGYEIMWVWAHLNSWEEKDGLHIQAVSLIKSLSAMFNPGVHYCKVISPYRAMEWVNIDSFRPMKGGIF